MLRNLFLLFTVILSSCQTTKPGTDTGLYSEDHLDFKAWNRTSDCCKAQGKTWAIASGGLHASEAGNTILEAKGNAVDAAVAVAFALAVERPHSAGLGGGGFLLLHLNGKTPRDVFIDFRETAPKKAHRDMYLDPSGKIVPDLSTVGAMAIGTPGFVSGLYDTHKRFGKLPWKQVLEPAIQLARKGFRVYHSLAKHIAEEKENLFKDAYTKSLLFKAGDEPLKEGELLVQKDLAKTLERIAANGKKEFETGETARKIASFVSQKGGVLSLNDLKKYKAKERKPITLDWQGMKLFSAPPPSAGGVLISQMLQVLDGFQLQNQKPADYLHLLAETMKHAYADRSVYVGDPDFYKENISFLTSKPYVDSVRKTIDMAKAVPSPQIQPGQKSAGNHTTHLSVIDAEGNAVASTITINDIFGCRLAAPGTGIFLNNEMDDFSAKPGEPNIYGLVGAEANAIAPLKRPVSSMSPTILVKDGKAVMAVGAAGGSRITTSVLQILLNKILLYPDDLKKAVFAPRLHHQWLPNKTNIEKGISESIRNDLKSRGHEVVLPPFSAIAHAVSRESDGTLSAVFDPRDEGGAVAH